MNVTEKQKQILINFMYSHPDFGRGRLRYNRENKKRIDELWEEVASALNCAGSGPQKLPKEWAKTWRDWKSNVLKKVATHKSYAGGTGGGPPKTLTTTPAEDNLLAFLTPEASGMPDIPEGGAIGDSFVNDSFQIRPLTAKEILTSQNLQEPSIRQTTSKDLLASQSLKTWKSPKNKTSCSQRLQDATISWQINVEDEHPCFYSNVEEINNNNTSDNIEIDTERENLPINISSEVLASVENAQQTPSTKTKNKRRHSDDGDTSNKKMKKQDIKHLFEQHNSDYFNIQQQMLKLKEEKMALAKEKFEFKKKAHEENIELLTSLIKKVNELTNIVQSIAPQYLE